MEEGYANLKAFQRSKWSVELTRLKQVNVDRFFEKPLPPSMIWVRGPTVAPAPDGRYLEIRGELQYSTHGGEPYDVRRILRRRLPKGADIIVKDIGRRDPRPDLCPYGTRCTSGCRWVRPGQRRAMVTNLAREVVQ